MSNPFSLSGRQILVTGASSGIGRETAILLSRLQARVIVSGRNAAALDQTMRSLEGAGHRIEPFDMNAPDGIPAWLKQLTGTAGPLDGLAHCAGIHSAVPLRGLSVSVLDETMRVNFQSAVMLARGLRQKGCRAAEGAGLVFLSSVAALAGEPGLAAYSASKAALLGVVRSLAMELAPERIRVNAIAPGMVRTEMSERMRHTLTPEQFEAIEKKHPLGIGCARDVAAGIAFLLAESGRWITGTTLVIDGGYTAHS